MKKLSKMKIIAMALAFSLSISLLPAGAFGNLDLIDTVYMEQDTYLPEEDGILLPNPVPDARDIEVLKMLDGVTLAEDGSVTAVKMTAENGITEEELELLLFGGVQNRRTEYVAHR